MLSFSDLWGIVFPRRCVACRKITDSKESVLCVDCHANLPLTFYWASQNNYLHELFAGRVLLHHISALFFFERDSIWRSMIHDMKYRSQAEIADIMGQIYGRYLSQTPVYKTIDTIIPVPLHKNRLKERGFNQAEIFALGIAKQLPVKVETKVLFRVRDTPKQALKTEANLRWENVEGAFEVRNEEKIANKTVMVVDDVITTGATIEECCNAISKALPESRFFIGAMACIRRRVK